MDVKTCIQNRRSVRRFQDLPVDRAVISDVVRLAQMAPSWKNSQTVRYIWIDNADLKARIAEEAVLGFAKNKDNLLSAPGMMVVTTVHGVSGFGEDGTPSTAKGDHWESFDAGLSVQTLCLALHQAGLGSVIMGLFDPDQVAALAGVPDGEIVSCILAVGYPVEGPHGRAVRKPLDDVLSFR